MTRHPCLLALLLLAAPLAAAPVPKALKQAKPTLDGTWEVVEVHSDGVKSENPVVAKWVIDGESLTLLRRDDKRLPARVVTSYSLVKPDKADSPAALDYVISYANAGRPNRTLPGVFELDGDTLKVCYAISPNGERPTGCKPAEGAVLYVFKRANPAK